MNVQSIRSAAAALLLIAGSALAQPALSEDLTARLNEVQTLDAAGQKREAFEKLNALTSDYYQSLPFQITLGTFVTKRPTAYATYDEYVGNEFTSGDTIHLYAEPLGLKWVSTPDGQFQSDLSLGVKIISSTDTVVVDAPQAGRIVQKLHKPAKDYYMYFYLNDMRLPSGQYTIEYAFTDNSKGETAVLKKTIVIR